MQNDRLTKTGLTMAVIGVALVFGPLVALACDDYITLTVNKDNQSITCGTACQDCCQYDSFNAACEDCVHRYLSNTDCIETGSYSVVSQTMIDANCDPSSGCYGGTPSGNPTTKNCFSTDQTPCGGGQ